ncbi:MAG: hypothetical protein ABIG43_02370 [Chloroflexota bacterium]
MIKGVRKIIIIFMILALAACGIPTQELATKVTEEQIINTNETAITLDPTPNQVTEEPQTAQCPEGSTEIRAYSVSFCFDTGLAQGLWQEIVPATPMQENMALWDVMPEHLMITFTNYSLPDTFHPAVMRIYPLPEFATMFPIAEEKIGELSIYLESQESDVPYAPLLPIFNAVQAIQVDLTYLSFRNGQGMRWITQYSQDSGTINNQELFYAFMGITDDEQYLVSAILPLSHPSLYADMFSEPEEGWENFNANIDQYFVQVEQDLSAVSPDSFRPSLEVLDAMMASLEVGPDVLP